MLIAGPGGFLLLSGAGVPAVNQPRGPRADRLFAVTASLLKLCTGLLTGGGAPGLLGNRQHCALVPVGAGTPLTQPAHQAGPLTTSLQAIIAVDRLVAVLPGVPVFDENLRHGPAAVAGQIALLAMLAVAGVGLCRLESAPSVGTPRPGRTADEACPDPPLTRRQHT